MNENFVSLSDDLCARLQRAHFEFNVAKSDYEYFRNEAICTKDSDYFGGEIHKKLKKEYEDTSAALDAIKSEVTLKAVPEDKKTAEWMWTADFGRKGIFLTKMNNTCNCGGGECDGN